MMTELGEAQPTEAEYFPDATAHSTPKQVEHPDEYQRSIHHTATVLWSHRFLNLQGAEAAPSKSQAQSSLAEDSESNLTTSSRITRSPVRNALSFRTMQTRVTLLDGTLFTCTMEVRQVETGGVRRRQVETGMTG